MYSRLTHLVACSIRFCGHEILLEKVFVSTVGRSTNGQEFYEI